MRFIHTGDWHLGRTLHGASLLDDQRWVLDRFIELVAEERPDAVVISGDVYDRAVPPAEAVALLDTTLDRIVRELGVPVLMIAGNHDSPDRIGFGSSLFGEAGLYVAGRLDAEPTSAVFGAGEGAVRVWLLPYADPITTRGALEAADVHTHDEAVRAAIETCADDGSCPRVLVTHHFVAGSISSESERPLSVGGSGAVGGDAFERFDYVALGHLHRPQSVAGGKGRYAGSLLKYSFDEAGHTKSVSVVEMEGGTTTVREVELGARRDVRRIEGHFDDVLSAARTDAFPDDYIEVILSDREMPADALGRLREYYPNLLRLSRRLESVGGDEQLEASRASVESLTDDELFARFFEYATGEALLDDESAVLAELLEQRERANREAAR